MGCGQRGFEAVWRCHQLLHGFLAKGHLSRVSRQSRLSVNDKVAFFLPFIPAIKIEILGMALVTKVPNLMSHKNKYF